MASERATKKKSDITMNKKGLGLNSMLPAALVIGVAIVGIAIVAQILGTIAATQTADSVENNLTDAGLTALSQWGDWFGIIVIVVIAVIVIGLLMLLRSNSD